MGKLILVPAEKMLLKTVSCFSVGQLPGIKSLYILLLGMAIGYAISSLMVSYNVVVSDINTKISPLSNEMYESSYLVY
jgi:hypothetical protein